VNFVRRDKKRILDEYLVASAQTGDRKAFSLLAKRWHPALFRHAWRLTGDEDQARDTLQDAWIDIIRGLPRLNDAAAFPAWSYQIVTRKCASSIRKNQQVRKIKAAILAEPVRYEDGEAIAEMSADKSVVSTAIAGLPSEQSSAMALYHLEDLSVAEISVALGVPVGTVKTRLMHARRKIRIALNLTDTGGSNEQ